MENNNSVCFVAKINEIKPNNSTNGVEFDLTNTFFSSVKKGT